VPTTQPLMLVFGGASVTDMLRNWVAHVRRLSMFFVLVRKADRYLAAPHVLSVP